MTINDIFKSTSVEETRELWRITKHIPQLAYHRYDFVDDAPERVVMKVHYYETFDSRRYATIASIWFDDTPVMLAGEGGREGHDVTLDVVTNVEKYLQMVGYILTLVDHTAIDMIDPETPYADLNFAYTRKLGPEDFKWE